MSRSMPGRKLLEQVGELLEGTRDRYVVFSENTRSIIAEAMATGLLRQSRTGRMVERPAQGPQSINLLGHEIPIMAWHITYDLTEEARAALTKAKQERTTP